MQAPKITGPEAFNLTHPEPISWKTAVSGWIFTVSGAGDSSFDGEYRAEDAATGLYRHATRNDRYLNYLNDYGTPYWSMDGQRVYSMPGQYYREGSLENGPADGTWYCGYAYDPAPTVTKVVAALTGTFRYQIVAGVNEPDADAWLAAPQDNAISPSNLAEGPYRLYVQEQIDDETWTESGTFDFTVSVFLLAGPVASGPALVNATYANFAWATGVGSGWQFTVTNASETRFNGIYRAHDEENGVYRHVDRTDAWLFNHPEYRDYWTIQSSYPGYMPGYYYTDGNLANGPKNTIWNSDYGGMGPTVVLENLPGLTGLFQYQVTANAAPDDGAWSTLAADKAVSLSALAPGTYHLFVREKVSDVEWTHVTDYPFTVAFTAITAPVITGTTPTDSFTPTLNLRGSAPGPERLIAHSCGRAEVNGVYAPHSKVNGSTCFKHIENDVYLWSVPDYGSRRWIIFGGTGQPPQSTTDYEYYGEYWYYNYNSTANGWPALTNWYGESGVPTLIHGTYSAGGGTGAFQTRVDGGEWGASFTGSTFTLPEQASGSHVVEAMEMGENGLLSAIGKFTIETSLIAAPTVTGPADSDGGWHLTFTYSSKSGTRGTRVFRYRLNGGPWSPEKSGAVNNNTIATIAQLVDGANTFEVQEKSTTGGWSIIGIATVNVTNGQTSGFHIPDGFRAVVLDPSGRECLWQGESLRRELTPLMVAMGAGGVAGVATMSIAAEEPTYLFVTSTDKYHLADCAFAVNGVPLTVAQLLARDATPCQRCNPPALA